MELAYSFWGNPKSQAPRIVLLHGMGGTGALWRPLAAALENDYRILAPDQRGHGRSRLPDIAGARTRPGYTPLEYGADVIETMEAAEFHPAWILGHSMGVRTACAAAHLRPEWVRGLILIDLGFQGVAGGGLGEGLATFVKILPERFNNREEAREFMDKNCPDPSIAQYLLAVSVRGPGGEITFPFDHAALIQTIHAARDVSVRTWVRELGARGMPILVLRGAKSLVWSQNEFAAEKALFADLPSVEFREVAGAGHGLPFERRTELVAIIREFTEGTGTSGRA